MGLPCCALEAGGTRTDSAPASAPSSLKIPVEIHRARFGLRVVKPIKCFNVGSVDRLDRVPISGSGVGSHEALGETCVAGDGVQPP